MFAAIAIILLVVWILGLSLHLLGAFIWLFLVLAVISGIVHFITGNNKPAA
jgi:hypothetical protein